MKAFLSTTFAPYLSSVTEVLDELLRKGVRAVELGSTHILERNLQPVLGRLGMEYLVHNFFPPTTDRFVVNLASRDREVRARSVEYAKNSISFCSEIGAKLYTVHPGFVTDPAGESLSSTTYDFRFGATDRGVYEESFAHLLNSIDALTKNAERNGVVLGVESQGSATESGQLLLQRPEEFRQFLSTFPTRTVGLNVNLGHLNLASRVFKFDRLSFIEEFAERIVALEISHNDGEKDDHGVLVPGAWYWPIIADRNLAGAYKIFEGRDIPTETAVQMTHWLTEAMEG